LNACILTIALDPAHPIAAASCTLEPNGDVQLRYEMDYLEQADAFALDPIGLPLSADPIRIPRRQDGSYGVLSDLGPESWGKRVVSEALQQRRQPLPVTIIDWLHAAPNEGSGCVQCATGPVISPVPLTDLSINVLTAIEDFACRPDEPIATDVLRVLWPGASLGGARPKTVVLHDGIEHIAKFSRADDPFNLPAAEYATMRLAHRAGITVPDFELVEVAGRPVFLTARFDRTADGQRLHYLSARTLVNIDALSIDRHELRTTYSYAGILESACGNSVQPEKDGKELFRRMVFNILVGNVDDHLRNHGYLMTSPGRYTLSPAFDLVPHPDAADLPQSIGVGAMGAASTMENALSQCGRFYLSLEEAKIIIEQVREAVSHWRTVFQEAGISHRDIPAFCP
jgi:serine/threonine-protein kinase HipA